MFNLIKKSLSGKSKKSETSDASDQEAASSDPLGVPEDAKTAKRNRSGEDGARPNSQKRKRLAKSKRVLQEDNDITLSAASLLPDETPDWGIKLLEVLQLTIKTEISNVNISITSVKTAGEQNSTDIKRVEAKLQQMQDRNKILETENIELKEKLLNMEYMNKRSNLIFEGVVDAPNASDLEEIQKLRYVLRDIPGLDSTNFRIDRCYRLDGRFNPSKKRRLLCSFNWYYDVQCVLRNRKRLPRGVYVTEDLPEEWNDRRKVLKPIFNAAKRNDKLKAGTKLSKDRLTIEGKTFTIAPVCNVMEANAFLDVASTCQRGDDTKLLFLGAHSPFSNLYMSNFTIDNFVYNCVEQYYQSVKAATFDDDLMHFKIMQETNPYKMKTLGEKVKNFDDHEWMKIAKNLMRKAVYAKFSQNETLRSLLLDSGDTLLAESSIDDYWGTGIHLHDKRALDKRSWKTKEGGVMAQILAAVRTDLSK